MEAMTYSNTLQKYSGEIENPYLKDSLASLERLVGRNLDILDWGNQRIAVPFEINVDLPSLGTYGNIDIRHIEPILIVFNIMDYPEKSPSIYTDRLDFPKNSLAHLYIANNNRPPAICYVRENADEWYANKRINDVIIRISNWFRAAAVGDLSEDGDQFEPLRLEAYYSTILYDYDMIVKKIIEQNPFPVSQNLSIAQFEQINHENKRSYKFISQLTPSNFKSLLNEIQENHEKNKEDKSKRDLCLAFVLWNDEKDVSAKYEINLPRTWKDFVVFCQKYYISYEHLEKLITEGPFLPFPVIVGIKRPKSIIGYAHDFELLNFEFNISENDIVDGKISGNFSINILSHNQFLTIQQAEKISDFKNDLGRSVVFGCGALGSKIVMHLARNGIIKLTLLDPDDVSSHNLVRHALFADSIGENKANALKKKINELYPDQETEVRSGVSFKDGLIYEKKTFEKYEWVFDFTASEAFFNKLSVLRSLSSCKIASASITDHGNLGLLYKEGVNRNPRIDDLQVYLHSSASDIPKISEWLNREQFENSNNLLVRVGIGCNSETTLLSDEKVSSHGAYFTGVLKREITSYTEEGKIYIHRITDDNHYKIETEEMNIKPFDVYSAVNSDWEIRFKNEILDYVKKQANKAGKSETGGVFLGQCNHKTKTIYVTDLLEAPSDSKGNSSIFLRGFKDLSNEIDLINKKTGGQIGYIGEWHSHPEGPDCLSSTDKQRVGEHKIELESLRTPLPVFLSIITPNGFYPYIF
ncbi:ThiF family adenylyltransferase [Chryseobacterium sp. APV1]|uniref:ThiF family adenylyltransferase n=1 Tax=Chryseobacterium urinae TaxID=3058400 RepID=A0ABT8TXG3_9FLAO|nr:ThiF family adenylyltransferase [Chryseobacterium sp. APV1]MDO3423479.1 ThiF family adenylyltransferase [Chryseobacterium sp. APV1]